MLQLSVYSLGSSCCADAAKLLCRLVSDLRQYDIDDKGTRIAGESQPMGLNRHFGMPRDGPSGGDAGHC
jgi:hypothetical protein